MRNFSCRPHMPMLLLFMAVAGHAAEPSGARSLQAIVPKAPIGRIFFSPAERRIARGTPRTASPPNGVAPSEHFSVDGAVSSSTKGRAVWINEVPIENSAVKKSAWTDSKGNVWFSYESLGTHLMRPGQTIDRSGKIEDLLPAGAVTRR
ncbi:MAG TPA: hypothetical protein VGI65_05440 [Steroidobacteraceae bacterium]